MPTENASAGSSRLPQSSVVQQAPGLTTFWRGVEGLGSLLPELRKEGIGWSAVFNGNVNGKRVLDVSLVHTLMHESVVSCVRFSADGKYLATGCNRTAQIYDTKAGIKTSTFVNQTPRSKSDNYIRSVCFSPDGKYLATASEDKRIRIWDIAKKRIRNIFYGHQQEVYSLDFLDGRLLVSGSGDNTIRIWDIVDRSSKVLTINETDPVHHATGVSSIAISPSGQLVAAGSLNAVVYIWDVQTGMLLQCLRGHTDSVCSIAFTSDEKGLVKGLVSGSLDKTLKYWDISGLVAKRDDPLTSTKKDDKGSQCIADFLGHTDIVISVAVSHDKQWIVSGSRDRGVLFWDAHTGTPQCMLRGHEGSVLSVDLAPERRILVTGNNDSQVQIDEPPLLATGSGDWQARIWSYTNIEDAHRKPEQTLNQTNHPTMLRHVQQPEHQSNSLNPPETILQNLTTSITRVGDHAVARGGFGEVWKCILQTDQGPVDVGVKALLVYGTDEENGLEKKAKRIRRELTTCASLNHKNILPVFGYTHGFGPIMALVCPWAQNGNLTTYLERENATLTIVRRFQILIDVSAGLKYLHANNVIHGDLTSPNVLVLGDGTACLADFGLSLVYSEVVTRSAASWTSAFHGNFRWLAPELLGHSGDQVPVRPSKHSDIYSFGGVMLQVLTNKVPYFYVSGDAAIAVCIYKGDKPLRSRYPVVPDRYWNFIEECWSVETDRPSAERVVEVISDEFNLSLAQFH